VKALLLLLPAVGLQGCHLPISQGCSESGCDSGAVLEIDPVPGLDTTKLAGVQVDVCLDEACLSGLLEAHVHDGQVALQARYQSLEPTRLRDGDIYSMRVVRVDGVEVAARAWSATYRTWQPNGEDCEPTCRFAVALREL
jgi:hypothetical protein